MLIVFAAVHLSQISAKLPARAFSASALWRVRRNGRQSTPNLHLGNISTFARACPGNICGCQNLGFKQFVYALVCITLLVICATGPSSPRNRGLQMSPVNAVWPMRDPARVWRGSSHNINCSLCPPCRERPAACRGCGPRNAAFDTFQR